MRLPREAATKHPTGMAALLVLTVIGMTAAACDSRVDVRAPRVVLPTVPTSPTTPAGAIVTETRPIAGVDAVALEAVGQVEIQLGAFEELVLTAPESVMPLLTSEVVGGRLILDRDSPSYQGQASDIRYEVTLVRLDELVHAGVGEMNAAGVKAARFEVEMTGVGNVLASGRADHQEVRMSGLGDYLAPTLKSRVTRIDMSAGDAVIWATERIEGRVAFGCTLEYHGDPVVDVSGGGTVRKIGFGS